jgi:hypothetical protein
MDAYRAFTFQKTDQLGNAVLRRNTQAQVDVVGHRMPIKQIHALLLAQIPHYLTNVFANFPI